MFVWVCVIRILLLLMSWIRVLISGLLVFWLIIFFWMFEGNCCKLKLRLFFVLGVSVMDDDWEL